MKRLPLLVVAAILTAAAGYAQILTPACDTEEYRQFDFWVGSWDVVDKDGNALGENDVESILAGCVLRESWVGKSGSVGHSFNIFDRQIGRWHQSWVDNSGLLLRIEGGLDESGAMVLAGTGKDGAGKTVHHRITWTPLADGRVRQEWQTSPDGEAWSEAFVGFYGKKPEAPTDSAGGGA